MKGDFSRDTFDPAKHFTRVLMQQGRVLLDSDWNEQTSLLLHYLRTLAADIIGPHGGPEADCGFAINLGNPTGNASIIDKAPPDASAPAPVEREPSPSPSPRPTKVPRRLPRNFWIGEGRYYVGGVLCENEEQVTYAPAEEAEGFAQPDLLAEELVDGKSYLVYLDVWERHVTALEDDSIRESALGAQGPDTATRARAVWQVKTVEATDLTGVTCETILHNERWTTLLRTLQPENRAMLSAKAEEADDLDSYDPCITSPDARYRGAENQLYRVEIHRGGTARSSPPATFKWSRENGSVVLPVRHVSGKKVTLDRMGRDARSGVEVGDWVEIFDDYSTRRERTTPLFKVTDVDPVEMVVTLSGEPYPASDAKGKTEPMKNPLLRRWDHKQGNQSTGGLTLDADGAAIIIEGTGDDGWLELEDGIRIQFGQGGTYRAGDYWLIPARTATGDVEWPGEVGRPKPRPPHGVIHHYAPLAWITVSGGEVALNTDYRRRFRPLPATCF